MDPQLIVPLETLVSHQHLVTSKIHSSVGQLLRSPQRHVPFPAHWVKVINVLMAKVVLHIRFVMKTERTQCLRQHLPQFLQYRWILIIAGKVLMMLPHCVNIPVQVVYLKIALEIFSVSRAHHAELADPFSVE